MAPRRHLQHRARCPDYGGAGILPAALFSAASYLGSFATLTLPALPAGLAWDTSTLTTDGSISVKVAPSITTAVWTNPAGGAWEAAPNWLGGGVASGSTAIAATPASQVTRTITGPLTLTAGNILDLTADAPPAAGVYLVAIVTGGIVGTPATVNQSGLSGTISITGNNLELTLGPDHSYLPRQDGTANGMTDRYRFELSRDGKRWVKIAEGEFSYINLKRKIEPQMDADSRRKSKSYAHCRSHACARDVGFRVGWQIQSGRDCVDFSASTHCCVIWFRGNIGIVTGLGFTLTRERG